jgi:hypothetical protein
VIKLSKETFLKLRAARTLERIPCNHCPLSDGHIYVCDCGHPHHHHTLGGGCKRAECSCDWYTQVNQRIPGETQKEFDKRVLAKSKRKV